MKSTRSIAIDLRPLQTNHRYRGIGSYVRNITRAIILQYPPEKLAFLYYSGPPPIDIPDKSLQLQIPTPKASYFWGPLTPLFRRRIRVVSDDVGIILQTDTFDDGPLLANVPVVPVFYDNIPLLFAKKYYFGNPKKILERVGRKGLLYNYFDWIKSNLKIRWYANSLHIITISNSSKQDLLRASKSIGAEKVSSIPLAPTGIIAKKNASLLKKLGITGRYILYVGGIDFRKNVVGLIENFAAISSRHKLQLVLAGFDMSKDEVLSLDNSPRTLELWAKGSIISTGFITDDELASLYCQAFAFTFPSLYEGFGLPPLEAMQAGCPVIAYSTSSMPEILDGAALLVDPGEPLTGAIISLLENEALRQNLIKKGRERAKIYSWETSGKLTIETLEMIADSINQKRRSVQ